jgi:hypothetical protein
MGFKSSRKTIGEPATYWEPRGSQGCKPGFSDGLAVSGPLPLMEKDEHGVVTSWSPAASNEINMGTIGTPLLTLGKDR